MTNYELVKRLSTLMLTERGSAKIRFIKADGTPRDMKIVLDKDFIKDYFIRRAARLEEAGTPDLPVRPCPEGCWRVIEEKDNGEKAWKLIRIDRLVSVD